MLKNKNAIASNREQILKLNKHVSELEKQHAKLHIHISQVRKKIRIANEKILKRQDNCPHKNLNGGTWCDDCQTEWN